MRHWKTGSSVFAAIVASAAAVSAIRDNAGMTGNAARAAMPPPEQRLVSLGPSDGDLVAVLTGVSQGDGVICGNLQRTGPGAVVKPQLVATTISRAAVAISLRH
jgi:hypothetical protein